MRRRLWLSILGYGLLAAAVLACLWLLSLAPLALDWGRELIGAAIAIVAMVIGLQFARRSPASTTSTAAPPATEPVPSATDATVPVTSPASTPEQTLVPAPEAAPATKTAPPLSQRERDVLQLLCAGQSNKQIARALNLSENTVKTHLANVYAKLGVGSRTAAQAAAHHLQLFAGAPAGS